MCKNKDEFSKIVRKRRRAVALKKKLESWIDKMDDEIIKYAHAKGVKGGKDNNTLIVFGDDYKASVIMITQHPWDGDKLRKYLGDNISQFQKTSTFSKVDIR